MKIIIFSSQYNPSLNVTENDNLQLFKLESFLKDKKIDFDYYQHDPYTDSSKYVNDYFYFCDNNDSRSLAISLLTNRWYNIDTAKKLLQKHIMPEYLGNYEFNVLRTKKIESIDDISFDNFFIKPIIGTGSSTNKFKINPHLSYKKYSNVQELLKNIDENSLNSILSKDNYCIQESDFPDGYNIYAIGGVTNGNAESYFYRVGKSFWLNQKRQNTIRKFDFCSQEKKLLEKFLKQNNIKNSTFLVQFIEIDNLLYPIDWNFRLSPQWIMDCHKVRNDEYIKTICHLYDIECNLPNTYDDTWELNRGEYELNDYIDIPIIVS